MTKPQSAFLGIGIGALIVFFIHPASRSLLLQPWHTAGIRSEILGAPLFQKPSPLPKYKESDLKIPEKYFLIASLIARNTNTHYINPINQHDYKLALEFFNSLEQQDPDNALWPQLSAGLSCKSKDFEECMSYLEKASKKNYWDNGSVLIVNDLWKKMESLQSQRFAWQGLFAIRFKPVDTTTLILSISNDIKWGERVEYEQMKFRSYFIINAGLIRDFSTTIHDGNEASKAIFRMAGSRLHLDEGMTPSALETERVDFVNTIEKFLGTDMASRMRRELRSTSAWNVLLKSEQDIKNAQRYVSRLSILVTSLPSMILYSGCMFFLIMAFGQYFMSSINLNSKSDIKMTLFISLLVGVIFYTIFRSVYVSGMFMLLSVFVTLPKSINKTKFIAFTKQQSMLITFIGLVSFCLFGLWIFGINPTSLFLFEQAGILSVFVANPLLWLQSGLLIVGLSTLLAFSWAQKDDYSTPSVLGTILSYLGRRMVVLSLFLIIILVPICLYIDNNLQTIVESWINNEPRAFRVTQQ